MKKRSLITIIIVITIIILAYFLLNKPTPETSEEIARCIGENSELYIQLGCHACKIQEEMFGENYQYLNIVDCIFNGEICLEKQIEFTPTWIINGEKYKGVQSIEKLQELTGC